MLIKSEKKLARYQDLPKRYFSRYRVNVKLSELIYSLNRYKDKYQLDMDPDFQRIHRWDEPRQIKFVEYLIQGGQSGKEIYFNCPHWMGNVAEVKMVLVDGKQRLEACRRFLENEIPIFGYYQREFIDRIPSQAELYFNVNDLVSRRDVLEWYLQLNDGGVAHTSEEIERVKQLWLNEK